MKRKCDNCGNEYKPDMRNFKRGWDLSCNKKCAAILREKKRKKNLTDHQDLIQIL